MKNRWTLSTIARSISLPSKLFIYNDWNRKRKNSLCLHLAINIPKRIRAISNALYFHKLLIFLHFFVFFSSPCVPFNSYILKIWPTVLHSYLSHPAKTMKIAIHFSCSPSTTCKTTSRSQQPACSIALSARYFRLSFCFLTVAKWLEPFWSSSS